jgi:excisionase family DNA binding protein
LTATGATVPEPLSVRLDRALAEVPAEVAARVRAAVLDALAEHAQPAPSAPAADALLDVGQAGAYLGVSRSTMFELVRLGRLKAAKIGASGRRHRLRFLGGDLIAYARRRRC